MLVYPQRAIKVESVIYRKRNGIGGLVKELDEAHNCRIQSNVPVVKLTLD